MVIEAITSLAVQSKLSEGFATVVFRDPAGWEFSATGFNGVVMPTRIFLSRFIVKWSTAPNDLRDYKENTAEIAELHNYCGMAAPADHYSIDDMIDKYMRANQEEGDTFDNFRSVVLEVVGAIETGDVVNVDAIPPAFKTTLPDRTTPPQFSLWAYDRAVFPA